MADRLMRAVPAGPAEEPGRIFFHVGLGLSRLAATLAIEVGRRRDRASLLEAHDRWLAWSGTVLGRAHGQLAWASSTARRATRRRRASTPSRPWPTQSSCASRSCSSPPTGCSAN
ncbi:MAG: hypothetical protein U0841_16415 [Chloroflexia bacterium]